MYLLTLCVSSLAFAATHNVMSDRGDLAVVHMQRWMREVLENEGGAARLGLISESPPEVTYCPKSLRPYDHDTVTLMAGPLYFAVLARYGAPPEAHGSWVHFMTRDGSEGDYTRDKTLHGAILPMEKDAVAEMLAFVERVVGPGRARVDFVRNRPDQIVTHTDKEGVRLIQATHLKGFVGGYAGSVLSDLEPRGAIAEPM